MIALWRSSLVWGFSVVDTVTTALLALEPKSLIHTLQDQEAIVSIGQSNPPSEMFTNV